jgi:hypothetical protein
MDTIGIELPARRRRRRHSAEFRSAVIEACRQPGVSVAAVALANGLNANMLRKWVNEAERAEGSEVAASVSVARCVPAEPATGFVPVALPGLAAGGEIRIEVRRAGTTISVSWPVGAAPECAGWLRELLR